MLEAYKSQYGLQGKVLRHIARHLDNDTEIATLNLFCSLATAVVLSVIVLLLAVKYNPVMACVFFLTFWLSPWIVNFARNLYWVEFTWFIPMACGLFCAWKINNRRCRIFSYTTAFVAVVIKCLCGYEYISTIMLGLISFLLVDFIVAVLAKEKDKSRLLFKTIFMISMIAVLGFITAVCIHAPLRGNGNILEGIKNIFNQDVLRRTTGADMNDFGENYWPSFNASVWDVYRGYFRFSTEIITGISGNLFPLLCCIPIGVFVYDYYRKKQDVVLVSMYIVFYLTSISWFCLAKAHSQIHTSMNYVMWYFGFVQICFYIIVNKIIEIFFKK